MVALWSVIARNNASLSSPPKGSHTAAHPRTGKACRRAAYMYYGTAKGNGDGGSRRRVAWVARYDDDKAALSSAVSSASAAALSADGSQGSTSDMAFRSRSGKAEGHGEGPAQSCDADRVRAKVRSSAVKACSAAVRSRGRMACNVAAVSAGISSIRVAVLTRNGQGWGQAIGPGLSRGVIPVTAAALARGGMSASTELRSSRDISLKARTRSCSDNASNSATSQYGEPRSANSRQEAQLRVPTCIRGAGMSSLAQLNYSFQMLFHKAGQVFFICFS